MRILFDTHAFLWAIENDAKLSLRARQVFSHTGNEVLLSVASIWEILLKVETGKLRSVGATSSFIRTQCRKACITILPILLEHVLRLESLPVHHRDPFDRIILAQALEERIPIVSVDAKFRQYPVEVLW